MATNPVAGDRDDYGLSWRRLGQTELVEQEFEADMQPRGERPHAANREQCTRYEGLSTRRNVANLERLGCAAEQHALIGHEALKADRGDLWSSAAGLFDEVCSAQRGTTWAVELRDVMLFHDRAIR